MLRPERHSNAKLVIITISYRSKFAQIRTKGPRVIKTGVIFGRRTRRGESRNLSRTGGCIYVRRRYLFNECTILIPSFSYIKCASYFSGVLAHSGSSIRSPGYLLFELQIVRAQEMNAFARSTNNNTLSVLVRERDKQINSDVFPKNPPAS